MHVDTHTHGPGASGELGCGSRGPMLAGPSGVVLQSTLSFLIGERII